MNDLGTIAIVISLALIIFSILQTSFGIYTKNKTYIELGRNCLMANFGVISVAFAILLVQLFRVDLNNHYVALHTDQYLGFFYRLTSIWAGSSGSLLFWNFLLTGFIFVALYNTRKLENERLPVMNLCLAFICGLFSFLAVFFPDAQPFKTFAPAAKAGRGLNPLLQHWAMIIHPPVLYLGYVSSAIPFGVMMSALVTGKLSEDWFRLVRRWTIFSWFFLGNGILLGSKWAYEELGWGGYWAWDPVENSSLMPWLVGTAFLHSLIIQERRKMLRFWNIFLIILYFHFCLLGTWITRSGVLEGPHSFSESDIGPPFIIYIGISFFIYSAFLIYRRNELKPERKIEAVSSKEGSFLFNNLLLIMGCLSILLGVFSPLLYGREFRSPWFNSWGVPAGILLLFLMGISPLLSWRKGVDKNFLKTILKPFLAGVIGTIAYILFYSANFSISSYSIGNVVSEIYSILTIFLGVFTIAGVVQEYHVGIMSRLSQKKGENYITAGLNLLFKNKRRYGGYLVHLAIVLLFIGYAGSAFKQNTSIKFIYELVPSSENEIIYKSQDIGILGNYQIIGSDLRLKAIINGDKGKEPNVQNVIVSQEATFHIKKGFDSVKNLSTERRFYPQISHLTGGFEDHIPTSEPGILSFVKEDLYIQLGIIESVQNSMQNPDMPKQFMNFFFTKNTDQKIQRMQNFPKYIVANLEIWINPLVRLIWLGSEMFFATGLLILLPLGEKRKT